MGEKKTILITDRFAQESLMTLESQPFLKIQKTKTPSLKDVDLTGVHGLLIRGQTQVTEEILKKAKDLQVIISCTSGFDHINLNACQKWGISIMHTPQANVHCAAQTTFALVLTCAQQILQANKATKSGEWRAGLAPGFELHRKTFGVVGLGRIGTKVAELAQAFGMNVLSYDPYIEEDQFREVGAERVAYEEILKRSDILSFHVPATKETENMLNRSHFEYINRGIIIINTSRGSVISEPDLCEALENGWVSSCGLDVFAKEPLPRNSKLLTFSQAVLTPHIGALTHDAFVKSSEQGAMKLIRFFVDGTTSDTLPPKAAWYGAEVPFKP